MDAQDVLRDVGLILLVGVAAIPIAALLRVPQMVVLLLAGIVLGPSGADIVANPVEGLGAQLVFTLGVSLILFHGGVGISVSVISRAAVGLGLLVLPGIAITALVLAVVAMPVFSLPFSVALLVGATLSATDPAILIPLFDRLRLRPKVSQTVIAESAFNDPTGTVLALTVAGVVDAGHVGFTDPLTDFTESLAVGAVLGVGRRAAPGADALVARAGHLARVARSGDSAAMVALAVLTTLLVQATTAGALARRLGLVETAEYVGAGK